ncbi:MAG TPA: hypothetical protein VN282_25340 [Pyrinomonadaceae bacterium]|nr:hypothetical protein [Pyrinomonadaceae bacterium]
MRFLTLALLFLLLLTPFNSAAAQSPVLAGGEPPLTAATVEDVAEFFGWLFETRFTPAERRELERILVATWRANDRKEIEAAQQFGALNVKLLTVSKEKHAELRAAVLPEVLKGARAEATDFSRLLLGVYESRAGGEAAARGEAQAEAAASGGDAAELLGAWRSSEIGMISYQNTITGSSRPGRGTTMQYKFLPGGRFEYNGYLETTMYNCTTTLFNPVAGTYSVAGNRLTIMPKTSKWQQTNNCASSMNKTQPGKLDPETYTFRFSDEQGGRRLCLTSSKGNEVCYRAE